MPTTRSAAATTEPITVPTSAGHSSARVSAAEARSSVRIVSSTQNPCDRSSTPASSRATASAAASRNAPWKYTDRGVRCSRRRCHHSRGVDRWANHNGPGRAGGLVDATGAPATTRTAATRDLVHSPRLSASEFSRSRSGGTPSGGVAARSARNAASAAATRSVSGTAAPSRPSARSHAAAASAHDAAWRRRAAAAGRPVARWASASCRSTARPSRSRAVPAAIISARSRRPADAGRSIGGDRDGRSASAASAASGSRAVSRSPSPARPVQPSASAVRQPASASTALASFAVYGSGVGSGHSTSSAPASSSTASVTPASRQPSDPGSYGGKHGRM